MQDGGIGAGLEEGRRGRDQGGDLGIQGWEILDLNAVLRKDMQGNQAAVCGM
jgi:hypothetical protein